MSNSDRLARLILVAWAGGLWAVCGLVVPALFQLIPDKSQAGTIAASFFDLQSVLGAVCGVLYWIFQRQRLDHFAKACVFAAVMAPLVFLLVLRPWMNAVRAAGDMTRFGQLHGIAGLLFLIACVALVFVVWRSDSKHPAA
jgi:hypothetical protein